MVSEWIKKNQEFVSDFDLKSFNMHSVFSILINENICFPFSVHCSTQLQTAALHCYSFLFYFAIFIEETP